ncbi:MAG TPA: cation:proton antiporter [Thermoleophilaceae bacterium]|nr:cation:proton antiporter [Thermoleophilaceae bacterium]
MEEPGFSGLLIVVAVAFLAPFLLGLAPRVRLPSVVFEIVAGIAIGPALLGWVEVDQTIEVLALIGLAFLLFLAGLEIDFSELRGRLLGLAALGWAVSFAIALLAGLGLGSVGLVESPLLVAIVLCATSLGVIVPVLADVGELSTRFGQLVLAAASIADFGAVILLSLFFSGESGPGSTAVLLGVFVGLLAAAFVAIRTAERSKRIEQDLLRLQDSSAQIRVRGAIVLMIAFVALAEGLGLELILGSFAAGALLSLLDGDRRLTHPNFRTKLEAMGFGLFIPVFFVTVGLRFDLDALLDDPANLAMVPIFLAALLAVRGLPALVYRGFVGGRRAAVAGVLQATSLPFIVAATAIGMELGAIGSAEGSALIAAGLLSVVIFPVAGLTLLRRAMAAEATGVSSKPWPSAPISTRSASSPRTP